MLYKIKGPDISYVKSEIENNIVDKNILVITIFLCC